MKYRYMIFVEDVGNSVSSANSRAVAWDPDEGSGTFDRVGASAGGSAPRSHAVCSSMINDGWGTTPMGQIMPLLNSPGRTAYRISEGNALDGAFKTGAVEKYESAPPGWQALATGAIKDLALSDMGLQLIKDSE